MFYEDEVEKRLFSARDGLRSLHQPRWRLQTFHRQRADMLTVAVEGELVSARSGDRQLFQTQVDIGLAEAGNTIFTIRLMFKLGTHHRRAFNPTKLDRERVLALRIAADLRKQPKCRQRRAKIDDEKAIEQPHETEFAALLLTDIVAQGGEK